MNDTWEKVIKMNEDLYIILLIISATLNFVVVAAIVFTAYYTSRLIHISENVSYIAEYLHRMQIDKNQQLQTSTSMPKVMPPQQSRQ